MSFLDTHLGELAAAGTACCWGASSLLFASASRQQTAPLLNVVRIVAATVVLLVAVLVSGVGTSMPGGQMAAILASGVVYVQTERDDGTEVIGKLSEGLLWGVLGVGGQAIGWVIGKVGIGAAAPGAWLAEALAVPVEVGPRRRGSRWMRSTRRSSG